MIAIPADVPRVSAEKAERAVIALDKALGGSKVMSQREACQRFSRDESETAAVTPDAVVLATSADDIATCLRICAEHEVPVTPRGAGSGRTGGSVPVAGGIVLATEGMKQVKEIARDDLYVVCEPGVITGELHALVEAEGLFYPPDPNSLGYCAIGGNVAENAGGPRAFKYGVTREYTLAADVVLMGGTRIRAGKKTVKGVTGYDVMATLVGSEGTLGVFTELTLRLIPKPESIATLLALFADVHGCGAATSAMIASGLVPRCLELVDELALQALRNEGAAVDPRAKAMLLIEVDGRGPLDDSLQRVGDACVAAGAIDVVVAQDSSQRARLWAARRELSPAIRKMARHKLSEDVVVPRSKVGAL
ncbi:MAG: FAD-binding protein, partial [Polyangiales bacterium]